MAEPLKATIKQRSGSVAISDAPLTVQGEYFAIDMPKDLAEFLWDAQQAECTIETTSEQIGTFTAICTNFIAMPETPDGRTQARAFFVRTEFLPQT